MSFQETVSAERVHIGFFGLRNAGKSSLVNALAGQAVSVVSDVAGTTTDPVRKAMELLPLGPVLLMDTPGLDDAGDLGDLRVQRAREVLARTDIAVLVSDARTGPGPLERDLAARLKERGVPWVAVYSKADLLSDRTRRPDALDAPDGTALYTSAATGEGIEALKARLGAFAGQLGPRRRLLDGLLSSGDLAVLVTPIDASAPKGRLILPQQQTMRELLDLRCPFLTCQDTELSAALSALREPPKLVITDSQAFARVADIVPEDVPLTSFSILFARYRGELRTLVRGAAALRPWNSAVHPPPPVPGHRDGEAPRLDTRFQRRGAGLLLYLRRHLPGGPVRIRSGGPLRGLYAERKGDGPAHGGRQRRRCAHGELRRGHCPDARYPVPKPAPLPRRGSVAGRGRCRHCGGRGRILSGRNAL